MYGEFCGMAYKELTSYFRTLAETNVNVLHSANEKRFYQMSMDEFTLGVAKEMPTPSDKCVVILINYHRKIKQTSEPWNKQEVLFYILKSSVNESVENEEANLDLTEKVVDQFLQRIQHDSVNGNPLFQGSMDELDGITIQPEELIVFGGKFIGWSCYFELSSQFPACYDPSNFGL